MRHLRLSLGASRAIVVVLFRDKLDPPTYKDGSNGEAGTDRGQQDQVALLQAAAFDGVVERQRNRRRGGVPELVDVDHDLLFGHARSVQPPT